MNGRDEIKLLMVLGTTTGALESIVAKLNSIETKVAALGIAQDELVSNADELVTIRAENERLRDALELIACNKWTSSPVESMQAIARAALEGTP